MIARLPVAILFWALAVPWLFEGTAYLTGWFPTISKLANQGMQLAGLRVDLAIAFLAGLAAAPLLLVLLLHFAGVLSWWKP